SSNCRPTMNTPAISTSSAVAVMRIALARSAGTPPRPAGATTGGGKPSRRGAPEPSEGRLSLFGWIGLRHIAAIVPIVARLISQEAGPQPRTHTLFEAVGQAEASRNDDQRQQRGKQQPADHHCAHRRTPGGIA